MATEVEPPELAALLDYAERPRVAGWSLRAALTRYAQPQPQRASDLIESMRRAEFGLRAHVKDVERNGPAVWAALEGNTDGNGDIDSHVVKLLQVLRDLDRVGDLIAASGRSPWRSRPRPPPRVRGSTSSAWRARNALARPAPRVAADATTPFVRACTPPGSGGHTRTKRR